MAHHPSDKNPDHAAPQRPGVTRRVVLRGGAVTGLALPLLAACGSDGGEAQAPATSPAPQETTSTPVQSSEPPESGGGGEPALAGTGEVPVGGGTVLTEEQIVLTQPSEGEFKAFTAVCTHQRCLVSSVRDGTITCGCHGSTFSAETGEVTGGPAPAPLDEIPVSVEGGQIVRG